MALTNEDKSWIIETTEKVVYKIVMEATDAILSGLEAYATKENVVQSVEQVKKEILGAINKNHLQVNKRTEKVEKRIYNLEERVESYHPSA